MADNRYYYFKDAKGNRHTVDKTAYDKDPMGFAKAFPGARMEVIDRKTGRRGDVSVKDASRVGDFGAHLFTGRTITRGKGKPNSSALGRAQQSVAQEKWGGGVVTHENTTASESASAPMENDSELVRGLKNANAVQRLQAPVSYTKPGAVKQMVKQTRERQHIVGQNVEQAGREFTNRERDRRNAPAFDLGNENVNNNIVKTRGQLEDELEESSRQLVDKQLGGYINNSIQKMFKDATVKGIAAEDALSKASPFAYMAAGKAYNEALDPDKLMNQLSKNAEKDMAGLFSDPKMQKEIAEKAASLGIDPEDYVKNYIAPGLQTKIAEEFEKSELSRNMPKSTAEYIIRGVNDSMIGTILSMGMMSKKQRQYAQQGMAMTDNGENPYVKPGMGARVARGTLSFAADAPVFGALGKAGAAVAGKVMGNGVAQAARIANTSLAGRIGRMVGTGAVSQGVTGVLYGSTNAAVQNYSTGDDTSIGNTVKLMTMGGLSEGASWATMGGIGGAVGAGIYNVSGVKRIPAKVFQLAMEGVGMHMGGNVAKMIEGHDTDWLSVEGNLEACANVVALKLTHARLPKRYAKDGKKESYLDMVKRNLANLMVSDGQRAAFGGYTFTNEEKEQLFGSTSAPKRKESVYGYDVHDNPLTRKESLTSWAMRAKKTAARGKGEESYKDTDAEFVKTAYDEIMADNTIPWDTKAKFSALVMGTVPSSRPMMEYIGYGGGTVSEYSKYGELLSEHIVKTEDERDSVVYSLRLRRENQRLSNAYGAAQIKDEKAAQETLETVAETFGFTAEQLKTAMDKDPLKRSEEEQNACVALRKAYEGEQFPEGTLHPDQSQTEGKDVVEENNLGTENPNNEAVAEVLNNMNNAEKTFNAALESNDVLKQEYERLTKEGLSEPQIYMELFNSGLTQEQLAPFADYINAKAKAVGMYRGTEQKIAETVQKHVEQWSYKGELNGEKQEGGQMLFVKDNNGRLLIVGAGDVAFDSEGRARESVGDMLSVLDPNTKEMDFVSKKDVQLDHVEKTEDYAKSYQTMLEEKNSEAYAESEKGKEGSEKGKVKSEKSDSDANKPNEASLSLAKPEGNEAHSYTLSEKKAGNGEQFYQDESGNIDLATIPDEIFEGIGYTKAPFRLTPSMIRHMLDRHNKELGFKDEGEAINFVVDVMNNFDHVRLGYDGALVFSIENGRKRTGKRAVTVLINSDNGEFYGLKTSGYEGIKGLEKRPLLWERGANESSSTDAASASVTTGKGSISGEQSGSASHQGNGLHGKDSNNSPYGNGSNETLTFADGSPVPMMKDTKGRETADYSQMTPEQGAEWMSSQFGENAEAAVDGQIKRAEKMLKEAEKIKVDYTGDLNDAKEAEAQKTKAVDAAKAELELYTNIKKVMTANKVKAGMEKVGSVGEEGSVSEAGNLGAVREKFESGKRIVGNKRTRTLADGSKLRGHYEIVEADSLTPSHNANDGYKKSEGFPVNEEGRTINDRDYENDKQAQMVTDMIAMKYDGQAVDQVPVVTSDGIVVDGNGRTMAGQKAAKNGTDSAYLEALKENAENYGFTAEQIEQSGIKHPRLVLVSDEPMKYDTATFAKFNKNEKKSQGNTQQAVANSKKLSADEIGTIISEIEGSGSLDAFFNNPTAINSLLKRLIDKGVIGLNEVAGLREGEDKLSAAGKDFVKNLLLGSVFSENTIRMMGVDAMLKTKALNGIRAVTDNMKLGDYALMKEIDQAVQLLYEARQGGSGVDAYLRTPAMFGENAADRYDPISQAIALALEGKVEDFRELMMAYNRNAAHYADASQAEMFGERPTNEEFIKEFLKLRNWKDYETRHSNKEGNGDAGSSEGGEPETSGGSGRRRKEGLAKSGDKTLERKNLDDVSTEENGGALEGDKEGKPGNDNGGSPDRDVQARKGQRQVDKAEEEKSDKPHEASLALTEPVEPTKPNGEEREGELPRTEEIEGDLAPQNKFKAYIESRDQGLKQVSPVAKALKEAVESGDKKRIKNAQKDLVEAILASPLGHGYLSSYLSICKNTKKNDKSYNVNKALIKPLTEVIKTIESALDSALKDAGLEGVHLSYDENGEGWIYADKNSPWYAQLKALDNDYRNISQIKENDPIAKLPQITLDNVADAARIIKSVIEEGERYNEYTEKEELNKEPISILPKKEEKAFDPIGKAAENYKKDHPSVRMQKVDDADYIENIPKEYRDFSDEHKVNPVNLFGYGESMKYNDSAAASRYLHDLKAMYLREHVAEKKALMEREGVSGLIANRRLFAPIEKAIKEKYGDVDVLIEERKKRVEAERNVMEAARKRAEEEERKRQQHLEELSLIPDGDLDKRYLEAMEKGDEATAREMLDESARRKGYGDAESDYQGVGAWSAPSDPGFATAEERRADVKENGGDVNVEDIAAGYSPVQEEMYSHPERTGFGDEAGIEAGRAINDALNALKAGKTDVKIKVYRAVPTSVKEGKLRNGDWVTPSRKYAEMHGEHRLDGKYRIMEDEVPASELWFDGNDIREWGYDNGKSYRYKNVKNNRKLNDLVTRDDKGNVIPPSKRFNQRKADERYQRGVGGVKPSKAEVALRDAVRDRAVEEKGIVMPNLNKEKVKVVEVEKHNFGSKERETINNAKAWAISNLVTTGNQDLPTMRDGTSYTISKKAIEKYLSESAVKKSENLDTHLSVLTKLTDVIHESIEAEIHADYNVKDETGKRKAELGYGNNILVHRLYGAVEMDGKIYRVKTTMQEFRGGEENKPHSYEVTKIELLDSPGKRENPDRPPSDASNNSIDNKIELPDTPGTAVLPDSSPLDMTPSNSKNITSEGSEKANESDSLPLNSATNGYISTAKLLQGVEKSYDSGKKLLDESKDLTDGETFFRKEGDGVVTPKKTSGTSNAVSERIIKTVEKVAKRTGGKVKMVNSVEEIENPKVRKDIENGKQVTGWYDENTGEVHLYMPNIHDTYTAEKTVWHETVGHKGMRGLLGDKFNDYMRSLWMDLDNPINAELRAYVKEKMNMNHLGFYDAIEEFIAKSAEDGKGEPGFWNYIKNKVTDALHEIGYRVSPNVKDVKYMLWLAKNVQKYGDSPLWKMRAEAVRWKIEHEKTEYTKIEGGELYDNDGKSHDFESMSREEWLEATDGEIHYRTAPNAATALDRYHHALDRHSYMATEAFMDNMLSLKKLMEAIDPSIRKIEDVNSSMNPYLMQNITEGMMSDKSKLFEIRYMDPLSKAMSSVLDSFDGKKVEDRIRNFNLYMIRKHGLERNRVLFVRDRIREERKVKSEESDSIDALETAWKDERSDLRQKLDSGQIDLKEYYRQMDEWIVQNLNKDFKAEEHDYSGMHGLQGIDDMKSPYDDARAIDDVMSQEVSMEGMKQGSVADFWKKVKAATDYSVNSDYENNIISKETHDGVLDMFDWYVPLRKFDEATAEDVYGYVTEMGDPSNYIGTTLMNAKGRKSLSNVEILAQIGLMGNRAIRNGGQNSIKLAFARFVRNSGEQNLVKETKVWVEKTGTDLNGNDIWEEAYPKIPEGASADDVATIVDAFETDMKAKQAKGEAKTLSNGTDIGFKFQRTKDKSQHFVDVKIAGRTHRFVVLGNPRAAQALNGMLENGKASQKWLQTMTRWMAMASTSWSPEFVMRNIVRDVEFASAHVMAKEGGRYFAKWSRYYGELSPINMFYNEGAGALKSMKWKDFKGSIGYGLYARYREGTLGNTKMERYFKEFMENGGETGFVQLFSMHDMEKSYKSIVEKESAKGAKKVVVNAMEVLKKLGENVESLNEVAENMARFATYCTSRDLGRSAARSAYDAKEVSTNFNRHGSGDAIKSFKNGEMGDWQKARRNTYGFVAGYLRNYSMFFNAGIQSTNLLFKNIKRAPVGTTVAMTSAPFALALIMAAVNNAIIQNEDDKDRGNVKDPYGELPDYIRRNNLCIYVGKNRFVTVPLAIELRAFYSLGDLAAGQTFAKNVKSQRNMAMDAVGCMSQLFPVVDFLNNPNYEKSWKNIRGMTAEALLPTAIVPFIEWWLNNDWKGAPIRRTGDKTELNPAWQNAYSNVPAKLVDLNKWVNAKTNNVAPGNAEMKGSDALDWITDPSMLNHFYESLSGGMGTTVKRSVGLVAKVATGKTDEIEVGDVPFLRSLFYTPREQSSMARTKAKWYNYKEEMEQTIANNDKLKSKNVPTMKRIENAAALDKFEGSPEQRKVNIIKNAEKRMRHWNTMRKKWADDKKQVDFANKNIEMIMQEAVEELDRIE